MCSSGAAYETSSNSFKLWFILQTLAEEESYHCTSLSKFCEGVAFSDGIFSLMDLSFCELVYSTSLRCTGLCPYTFGHQKQGGNFSSNSTNAHTNLHADILGRKTQALLLSITVTLAGLWHCPVRAQWIILILRNDYFAPTFPMEAEVWAPNRCTVALLPSPPGRDMCPTGSPASATSWQKEYE